MVLLIVSLLIVIAVTVVIIVWGVAIVVEIGLLDRGVSRRAIRGVVVGIGVAARVVKKWRGGKHTGEAVVVVGGVVGVRVVVAREVVGLIA